MMNRLRRVLRVLSGSVERRPIANHLGTWWALPVGDDGAVLIEVGPDFQVRVLRRFRGPTTRVTNQTVQHYGCGAVAFLPNSREGLIMLNDVQP